MGMQSTHQQSSKRLRPIDEIADDAEIFVRSNAACMWLVGRAAGGGDASGGDSAGEEIRYRPPRWLCAVVAHAEMRGEERARREMRAALGFVDVEAVPAGAAEASQAACGCDRAGCCCDATVMPDNATLVPPDETPH